MEEKKESCNISFSRELVEKALKGNSEKNEENSAYEIFREYCISFFKKFGSECVCKKCEELVIYILGKFVLQPAHEASLEFEAPLYKAFFKIGGEAMEINIQLKKEKEPPIS